MASIPKKKITMSDVARAAQVSPATVSVVLTGRYSTAVIAQETRARVLQAAQDLGYRRNALAQAVRTGRSYTLGFLMMGTSSIHGMLNFAGALDEAEDQGYSIKRYRLKETPEDKKTIERCLEQQFDGIIVTYESVHLPVEVIESEFHVPQIPLVRIAPTKMSEQGIEIRPNDEQGIYDGVQHLAGLGHQRIAFIGGFEGVGTAVPRLAGFQRGIRDAGMQTSYVRWTEWNSTIGLPIVDELLAMKERPTALMCGSDTMALGILQHLWRKGVRVPDDISIMGCGNMMNTGLAHPALTTIKIPYHEIGRESVRRVLTLIDNPESQEADEEILLPSPLLIRESTQAPPA